MGSSYIHQHSLFQSTLGRQGHKITATIVIYDLHVSKRPSILNLYTNNTSSIISRSSLRYCQKEGTLFPLSKKRQWAVLFDSLLTCLRHPCAIGSQFYIQGMCYKQFCILSLHVWEVTVLGADSMCRLHAPKQRKHSKYPDQDAGCETEIQQQKRLGKKKKTDKKKRGGAQKKPFGPETVFLFG